MKPTRKRPNVFDYDDYRAFLTDWFAVKPLAPSKKTFAERAGCSSATISLVLKGERNLSYEFSLRFRETLDRTEALTAEAWEAFPLLVQLTHGYDEDGNIARRLERLKALDESRPMSADRFAIFSDRLLPVLFELVRCSDFREDSDWIGARLRRPADPERITWALEKLLALGYLKRKPGGRLQTVAATFIGRLLTADSTAEKEVKQQALRTMHRQVVEDGWAALQDVPRERRHFGTSTVALSSTQLPQLREEIERFEERVLALSAAAEHRDEVYQFNIQLFPVTDGTRED